MKISPINQSWIHLHLIEAPLQGCRMMNVACKIKEYTFAPKERNFYERCITWIVGAVLTIPVIGHITWIAMKTFGNPEILVDPFYPTNQTKPASRIESPKIVPLGARTHPPKKFSFKEFMDGKFWYRTHWTIETFEKSVVVNHAANDSLNCSATYSKDLTLKQFHHERGDQVFHIDHIAPKKLEVIFKDSGIDSYKKTVELDEDLPWIQHPMIGFEDFIKNDDQTMSFYGILPEHPIKKYFPNLLKFIPFISSPPLVMKCNVKKCGLEDVKGYGQLMKLEVVSDWAWPYNSKTGKLWFDPKSGELKKFDNPVVNMVGFFSSKP